MIDATGNATSYAYDDADRPIQVTDAEGRITQQIYTNDNKPFETKQVVAGSPVTVKTVTYTPNGQTLTLKDGSNRRGRGLVCLAHSNLGRPLANGSFRRRREPIEHRRRGQPRKASSLY